MQPKVFFTGMGLAPVVAVIVVLLLLSGCAQYEAAKDFKDKAAEKVVDKAYDLTCNMRYKTEQSFKARHGLNDAIMVGWCKRLVK